MGNAIDALKSHGYRVTGTNDEAGLATAIRERMSAPREISDCRRRDVSSD